MGKDKGGNFDKIDGEYRDAINKSIKNVTDPKRGVATSRGKNELKRAIGKVERGKGKGSGKK